MSMLDMSKQKNYSDGKVILNHFHLLIQLKLVPAVIKQKVGLTPISALNRQYRERGKVLNHQLT